MTKSDAIGAQSLEEILAQIKKSVAGDAGPARSGGAASAGAVASGRPIDGGLSARLAGVLKDTGSATPPDDDSGLLAGDEKTEGPAGAAKLMEARRQAADPLWFLRQPAGTVAQDGAPTPTAPETGGASKEGEVRLSRPQDLRASLPPLFGAEDQPLPLVRMPVAETQPIPPQTSAPEKNVGPDVGRTLDNIHTAKTQPLIPPPDMERSTADGAGTAEPKPAPEVQAAAPAVAPLAEPSQEASPVVEDKLDDSLQPMAQAASMAMPDPVAKTAGDTSTPPGPGLQARSLEQVIGELLEPVIRHWLEANLPRLTEEVVRKEVARALAAERATSVV